MSGECDPRPVVAATLRAAADWFPVDMDNDVEIEDQEPMKTLRRFAADVEWARPDDACCALCEEATCDEDCPMREWRAAWLRNAANRPA